MSKSSIRTAKAKTINDPVHGYVQLPPTSVSIVDTPHFQRLRDLKQLGATYYVFPGASHNRFEHSLGVSHLSHTFFHKLCTPEVVTHDWENEYQWKRCARLVQVAGLVHDLGHGPFSHLFDRGFLKKIGNARNDGVVEDERSLFVHENRSVLLFQHLVDTYAMDFEKEEIDIIVELTTRRNSTRIPIQNGDINNHQTSTKGPCSLAKGEKQGLCPGFVYQIVNNRENGIDTDKFDYLARDIKNIPLSCGFDHKRIMNFSKVLNEGNKQEIGFHKREFYNIYDLFLTRFKLHRLVCNHRTTVAIDGMITDIFLNAEPLLKMVDTIDDPEEFLKITDSVLKVVEFSKDPRVKKAKHLVERLRRRELYRFVREVIVPDCYKDLELNEVDVTTCQEGGGYNLKPEDIYITKSVCNLGMNSENPVERVKFYGDDQAWYAGVEQVIPRRFEERLIRVYTRCEEEFVEVVREEARKAFRNCLRKYGLLDSEALRNRE